MLVQVLIPGHFEEWTIEVGRMMLVLWDWFDELTGGQKYEVIITVLAVIWVIRAVTWSTNTKRKKKKHYWQPEENKFIGPENEDIPREYYWDPIDCRWYPPEHPKHPNNKDKLY